MKFIYKYPSRGRPDWFKETLAKWYENISGSHEFEFHVTMDDDDASMNNSLIRNWLNNQRNLQYSYGPWENKIQACNACMPDTPWDIYVLVSDDMIPMTRGFDDIIFSEMTTRFPDLDGVLHFFDGTTRDTMTCSIVGRKFYERMGFVYWPSYRGVWCDNEITELAKQAGKYHFDDRMIIQHKWRQNSQYGCDEVYQKGESTFQQDRIIFENRQKRGFPQSFSQNDEDWTIRRYFKDKFHGRFLDIGAADGVTFSNTRILYEMGWSGVCVEASPNLVHACKENTEYSRVTVVSAALTDKDGPVELWHNPDLTSTLSEAHRATWENTTPYRKIGVDGICWQTLLAKYGCDFDFMNLDIEGENIRMLGLMPKVYLARLRMACIECDGDEQAVRQVFEPFGFKLKLRNGENVIWAK